MALLTLNEIYASGGQLPLITLDIVNAEAGALKFVLANEPVIIDDVEYEPSAFTVQMPVLPPRVSATGQNEPPLSLMAPRNRPLHNGEAQRMLTEMPPADSPAIVTLSGSPPKAAMLS